MKEQTGVNESQHICSSSKYNVLLVQGNGVLNHNQIKSNKGTILPLYLSTCLINTCLINPAPMKPTFWSSLQLSS
jgi:hypothetical protein